MRPGKVEEIIEVIPEQDPFEVPSEVPAEPEPIEVEVPA
jgi:hypothetical protein